MIRLLLLRLISAYKKYISVHLGNNCRFMPSCSEYAYEAIERYGVLKGSWLALGRILRCNPFNKNYGYDPVPEKGDRVKFYVRRKNERNT